MNENTSRIGYSNRNGVVQSIDHIYTGIYIIEIFMNVPYLASLKERFDKHSAEFYLGVRSYTVFDVTETKVKRDRECQLA